MMALVKGILISDWLGILLNSLSLSDINKEQKRPEVFVGNKKPSTDDSSEAGRTTGAWFNNLSLRKYSA